MPKLPNRRHEAFAQILASHPSMSLIDAYEKAGFIRRRGNAGLLARQPEVKARIEELQRRITPEDFVYLEYAQAKLTKLADRLSTAAGKPHIIASTANDLRDIASALDQQAGRRTGPAFKGR